MSTPLNYFEPSCALIQNLSLAFPECFSSVRSFVPFRALTKFCVDICIFKESKYKQILRKKELYIDLKSTILDLLNGRKIDSVSHYTLPYLNVIIFKITIFKNGSPCIPISARGAQGNNHIILVKIFKSFFFCRTIF